MLQGQWAAERPGVRTASPRKGIGDALGWFPFPMVEGGAGLPTDVFGGGDNFVVGRDAPPEAVEFLKWLTTDPDVVAKWVALGDRHPARRSTARRRSITDPNMPSILEARGAATFAQGYLDQVTSPDARRRDQRGRRRPRRRRPVAGGRHRRPSRRQPPPRPDLSCSEDRMSGSAFAPARSLLSVP